MFKFGWGTFPLTCGVKVVWTFASLTSQTLCVWEKKQASLLTGRRLMMRPLPRTLTLLSQGQVLSRGQDTQGWGRARGLPQHQARGRMQGRDTRESPILVPTTEEFTLNWPASQNSDR
jgi:hypothetical protein